MSKVQEDKKGYFGQFEKCHRTYPLHVASGEKSNLADTSKSWWLVRQGVNEIDDDGKTPVYRAAYHDKKDVVRYLMSKGAKEEDKKEGIVSANVDRALTKKYKNGGTPLVRACEKGRLEDVRVLVERHDVEKTGMSVGRRWSVRKGRIVMVSHAHLYNRQ